MAMPDIISKLSKRWNLPDSAINSKLIEGCDWESTSIQKKRLDQWFSTGGSVVPQEHLAMS